ncbi:hypothetical protein BC829DRAFT_447492 [Chytridium lagenaria]|nr:hypothetical protein BC829DRAFT_447492 [Chytridium lagenaria]
MPSTLPVPVTERSFTTYSGLRLTAKHGAQKVVVNPSLPSTVVIETLGWTTFKLLGHAWVVGVISVESFGPYAIPTQDVDDVEHYTAFKQVKRERNEKSKKTVFVGLAEAVNVRREGLMPVESTDSFTNTLMGRPTVPVAASRAATEVVMSTLDSLPPSLAFSITQPEQTTPKPWSCRRVIFRRIACPVLVLWGETGLKEGFNFVNRAKIVKKGLVTAHMLPGGHHLHLEPRTLGACVDKLEEWLSE